MTITSETVLLSFDFEGATVDEISAIKGIDVVSSREKGKPNKAGRNNDANWIAIKCASVSVAKVIMETVRNQLSFLVASEIEVSCQYWYSDQCNIWISGEEILVITQLGASLSISCAKN